MVFHRDPFLITHLFSIYMLLVGAILKHNINYHCYADDLQLYHLPIKPGNYFSLDHLFLCLNEVKTWMTKKNSLQLNENKTDVLLQGPAATNNSIKTQLGFRCNNLYTNLFSFGLL